MIVPPEAPVRPPRPATVTVAFALQLAVVGVLLAFTVLTVVEAVVYDGLIDEAAKLTGADPDEVSFERTSNVEWVVMTGLPVIAVLALFAATAFPVRSGRNVARILTWVGSAVPLLCCFVGGGAGMLVALPLLALAEPVEPGQDPYWPEDSAFYDRLYELEATGPAAWLNAVVPMLLVAAFLMAVAIAVLLLVPPSNRYFRPPVPPVATPGYPFAYPVPPGYVLVPVAALAPWATTPRPPPAPPPPPASPEASGEPPPPQGPANKG